MSRATDIERLIALRDDTCTLLERAALLLDEPSASIRNAARAYTRARARMFAALYAMHDELRAELARHSTALH